MLSRRCGQALAFVCALSALGFWGCRDAADACSGATCASGGEPGTGGGDAGGAPSPGDSAGADDGAPGGQAGAAPVAGGDSAGAAPTSACHTDADCADGHACNGDERCVMGQCQAGKSVRCGTDLSCVEHAGGTTSCDYGTPGRWFTFLGSNTGLFPFELRTSRLEGSVPRPSISLSEGIVDRNYQMIDVDTWSPNGRHMIVLNPKDLEHINTNRLFLIEFGDGLPSAPVLLKDIPVGANSLSRSWAADSSAVFVQAFSTPSETYLVHVAPDGGMRTELMFSEDEDTTDLEFCANPRYFYRTKGGDSTLVDSQQPKQEKLLWHGWAETSPDRHWVLTSDDTTGIWLAACEPGAQSWQLSAKPAAAGFTWSSTGRFLAVAHGDPPAEIEVFDASNQFQSVLKRAAVDFRWAPSSPRLMLLGAPDAKGLQTVTEVDFSTLPASSSSSSRGSTAHPSGWDFANDGTLWATRDEASGSVGFWVLESGTNVWRRVATGLTADSPAFTANGSYAVFYDWLADGTTQFLAFSLHDQNPVAIPLLPAPLTDEVNLDYTLNQGLIVSRRAISVEPYEGQMWWIASSASGFGKPVPLSDVRAGTEPRLQPEP